MRTLYVFSTKGKQEALSLSDTALAKLMREQRAQVVLAAGLVEHAFVDSIQDSANSVSAHGKNAA